MSQFVVSARKYRPQTFDTVVGQGAITSTLLAAIKNDHLAQAFLFCGPRGVGKTSCARILARTINCENLGADLSSCGTCAPCMSFNEGHSLNIYELDAASNNSVENIRDLTLQVNIAPQIGSKKVYIIDEVHMLSQAAFNAFLKTLEEPPSYAIFILATTEKHKILPTILSRCQVFDFRRIAIKDMVDHLANIAAQQGITAEPQALHAIAEKADGGMRDALSIFDQLVSYTGELLTFKDVAKNLNILDHSTYFGITEKLLSGDTAGVLVAFDDVLQRGFDGHHFVNGLGGHLRNLLVVQDERSASLLEASEDVRQEYVKQSKRCGAQFLFDSLDRLAQCDVQYRSSKQPRLLVELTLIRCCEKPNNRAESRSESSTEVPVKKNEEPEPAGAVETSEVELVGPAAPPQTLAPIVAPVPTPKEPPIPQGAIAPDTEAKTTPAAPTTAQVEEKPLVVNDDEGAYQSSPARRRGASGISINTFLEKTEEEETTRLSNEVDPQAYPVKDIPHEELAAAWRTFAQRKKQEGKNSLCATLLFNEPRLDGNMIHFKIVNEVQERDLREERFELLTELRKAFDAPGLELQLSKEEVGEIKPRYTIKDRFTILAEKNPGLNDFKDKLKLDL